jgi:hypothetical protein
MAFWNAISNNCICHFDIITVLNSVQVIFKMFYLNTLKAYR